MTHRIAATAFIASLLTFMFGTYGAHACDKHACAGEQANCASAAQTGPAEPASNAAPAAGMRVNIDPNTGQYVDHPVAHPGGTANVTTRSVTPPAEAPLPSGGTKLNTRGVRQEMTATANPGGTPETHCNQVVAPPAPQN